MQLSAITITLALATAIMAIPVPQANKIGAGIYDTGTGLDDSSGYDVQNLGGSAENILEGSTSLTAIGTPNSNPGTNHPERRTAQVGNDAGGAQAIFDGIDAGAGQGVENGMDNAGTLIENEGFAAGDLVPSKKQRGYNFGGRGAVNEEGGERGDGVYCLTN